MAAKLKCPRCGKVGKPILAPPNFTNEPRIRCTFCKLTVPRWWMKKAA